MDVKEYKLIISLVLPDSIFLNVSQTHLIKYLEPF